MGEGPAENKTSLIRNDVAVIQIIGQCLLDSSQGQGTGRIKATVAVQPLGRFIRKLIRVESRLSAVITPSDKRTLEDCLRENFQQTELLKKGPFAFQKHLTFLWLVGSFHWIVGEYGTKKTDIFRVWKFWLQTFLSSWSFDSQMSIKNITNSQSIYLLIFIELTWNFQPLSGNWFLLKQFSWWFLSKALNGMDNLF